MGLFSFIGSVVSTVAQGIGNIVSGVTNWVKRNIFKIEELPEYDVDTATMEQTQKVNELLEKCIESYGKQAREYDEIAKKLIEEYCGNLVKKLMELNMMSEETIIDSYVFQSFKNNYEYIKKDLEKIYSKQIANVFSLNNNKLLDILALPSGEEKRTKITNLALNAITVANKKLMETIAEFAKKQNTFILEKLNEYMQNREASYLVAKTETEKILKNSEENNIYKLTAEENYNKMIEELDLISEVLN